MNFALNNGTITINTTGIYELAYSVVTISNGTSSQPRGSLEAFVELDDGNGFQQIQGSVISNYLRANPPDVIKTSVSKTIVANITEPNSRIRVMFSNSTSSGTGVTSDANESTLFIKKMVQ